ncbi:MULTISPECIES: VPA1262 family N-terminal domain-containing protein [unclassified Bradyrhizobium]|uniref:VPA1262 family N-terminal domain-containing protein n=1 Tax=unclassified Bradyrhizobium TaxID=2631580 RepID=UPI00339847A5
MAASWWIWTAWIENQGQTVFIYGALAETARRPDWTDSKSVPLDDGAVLIMRQALIEDRQARSLLDSLDKGLFDLGSMAGVAPTSLQVGTIRHTIVEALGHSAARLTSYCSFTDHTRIAGPSSTWCQVLSVLERELGLPFTKDYASHVGNFELIGLQDWLDGPPPFAIEFVEEQGSRGEKRNIRALQICRSEDFAQATHIAHVVGYGDGERLFDRLLTLRSGNIRSKAVESSGPLDRYELSLFNSNDYTLIHRETRSSLTEINLTMSMAGRRMRIEDRLSGAARQVSLSLGDSAANVEARSSQRSRISLKEASSRREHASALRALAAACFPPKSDDRWFRRALDNEVGVIRHFDHLLHGGYVKAATLIDPFFGAEALERVVLRLQSTDVALTIVTSWARTDPDTGRPFAQQTAPGERLQRALDNLQPFINLNVEVINLVAGSDQAFHDRYLVLYPHEGPAKVFLLSNSVNKMAGNWPFCMALLSEDVSHEVRDYIEGLVRGQDITGSTTPTINFAWPPGRRQAWTPAD